MLSTLFGLLDRVEGALAGAALVFLLVRFLVAFFVAFGVVFVFLAAMVKLPLAGPLKYANQDVKLWAYCDSNWPKQQAVF